MTDIRMRVAGEDNASATFDAVARAAENLNAAAETLRDSSRDSSEEAGKSVAKWNLYTQALESAANAVYGFGKKSVEAFLEQEKADRQLRSVAGELTDTFRAQASAMQETLGVSDDMVEKMQTMLLRFGEAPADVDATVRALLDYSAATGTDAVAATEQLLSSVNSGKTAFKELGTSYDSTGVKAEDLRRATSALSQAVGGSAQAEANSVVGSAAKAAQAFGELQEAFGSLIVEFAAKTNVVKDLSLAIQGLQMFLFGDESQERRDKINALLDEELRLTKEITEAKKQLAAAEARGDQSDAAFWKMDIESTTMQLNADKAKVSDLMGLGSPSLPTTPIAKGSTLTAKAARSQGAAAQKSDEEMDRVKQKNADLFHQAMRDDDALEEHALQREIRETQRMQEGMKHELDEREKFNESLRKAQEKFDKEQEDAAKRLAQAHEEAAKRATQEWERMATTTALRLVEIVGGAIQALQTGDTVRARDIIGGVLGVAGGLVGAYFGGATGASLGSSLGSLGGQIIGTEVDRANGVKMGMPGLAASGVTVVVNTVEIGRAHV